MSMIGLLGVLALPALASEGMWKPDQVSSMGEGLAEIGLEMSGEDLGNIDGPVLGAIVDLSHCSGAFVSADGLVATSYHCLGSALQFASREGENLFEQGFHARTRGEERPTGPSERVRLTIGMDDVTDDVLSGTGRLEGRSFFEKVQENSERLVSKCEDNEGVQCRIALGGQGAEYQLVKYREFKDVRIVYAPPRSVGYFGGGDDNWQWPRHSGDFAFLRVYAGEGNKAKTYHADNQPYKPSHHLAVSRRSVAESDFVMVAGYPRQTFRWRNAAELDYVQNEQYPRRVESARMVMEMLEEWAGKDASIAAKVGPKLLSTGNNLQYMEGTLDGFARTNLSEEKWAFEKDLEAWIQADKSRKDRYGTAIGRLNVLQAEMAGLAQHDEVMANLTRNSAMISAAIQIYTLAVESEKPNRKRREGYKNQDRPRIESVLDSRDAGYDWRVDRAMLRVALERALNLPSGVRPKELDTWFREQSKAPTMEEMLEEELTRLYENNDLADSERRRSLMDSTGWYLTHHGNPWFELAAALYPSMERNRRERQERNAELRALKPLYMQAVGAFVRAKKRANQAEAEFISDANGTLRVTVGTVKGYSPSDGMRALPQTSLQGILEKHGAYPYDAPKDLIASIEKGQWGSYGDERLGSISVNFVSDLDTSRGSSGSATMDANGNWVGLIFDGNYESMVSDWVYDERLTRSIHTDVSYVLWYLDAVAGAHDLLRELGKEPEFGEPTKAP